MPTINSVRRALSAALIIARANASHQGRAMLAEMRRVQRALPARYEAQPLPDFLTELTPESADWRDHNPEQVRRLVDAISFWDRSSPFGICLRRSLLRYHFLRRAGLPLGIVFAMRARQVHEPPGLAGHAWNILDGRPYHESADDMMGFTEIYRWPQAENDSKRAFG